MQWVAAEWPVIRDCLIAGVTDVWSAIRRMSGRKLLAVLNGLSLDQVRARA
jgi:hypothetical protein